MNEIQNQTKLTWRVVVVFFSIVVFSLLWIRSYTYLDRIAVGDPEGFCAGFLSGNGVIRLHVYPDIEHQFFTVGFRSTPLEGEFQESRLGAGYDGRISGGGFYYVTVPWVLAAFSIWIFMIALIHPGFGKWAHKR